MNEQLYKEHILDHNANPRNFGELPDADVDDGKTNVTCGDEVRTMVTLDGETITKMHFMGRGCAISQAATSMLTEHVVGKTVQDILAMNGDSMLQLLGVQLSPSRMKCATLGLESLQRALRKRSDGKTTE
jgi:nitrogen fixation NifU-like protein